MKIIITGDIHGMFGYLNTLIKDENPDLLIVCGDFGYGFQKVILRPLKQCIPKFCFAMAIMTIIGN